MVSEERIDDKVDIHIIEGDMSSTLVLRKTECCGGYHQTIAGALLGSEYWRQWYAHASMNGLYDVDETQTIDAMSDKHFKDFIRWVIETNK